MDAKKNGVKKIEKTVHFFGDAVDLENIDTSEMVTLSMRKYRKMSETLTDAQIFNRIQRVNTTEIYLPSLKVWITI